MLNGQSVRPFKQTGRFLLFSVFKKNRSPLKIRGFIRTCRRLRADHGAPGSYLPVSRSCSALGGQFCETVRKSDCGRSRWAWLSPRAVYSDHRILAQNHLFLGSTRGFRPFGFLQTLSPRGAWREQPYSDREVFALPPTKVMLLHIRRKPEAPKTDKPAWSTRELGQCPRLRPASVDSPACSRYAHFALRVPDDLPLVASIFQDVAHR